MSLLFRLAMVVGCFGLIAATQTANGAEPAPDKLPSIESSLEPFTSAAWVSDNVQQLVSDFPGHFEPVLKNLPAHIQDDFRLRVSRVSGHRHERRIMMVIEAQTS